MFLPDAMRAEIVGVLTRLLSGGVQVLVFGSRVHGRNLKPFSDLDLCLKGDEPVSPDVMLAINEAFRDGNLPIRVDVVDWHALSDEFRRIIEPDLTAL